MENTSAPVKMKRLRYPPRMYLPHRFVTNLGTVYFASPHRPRIFIRLSILRQFAGSGLCGAHFPSLRNRVKVRPYFLQEISAIILLDVHLNKSRSRCDALLNTFQLLFPTFQQGEFYLRIFKYILVFDLDIVVSSQSVSRTKTRLSIFS